MSGSNTQATLAHVIQLQIQS